MLKFSLVCHLLRMGVSSIFGPQSNPISSHVQSICDTMEIPHLEMRWDYQIRRENCLVNLYPHPSILSRVISYHCLHSFTDDQNTSRWHRRETSFIFCQICSFTYKKFLTSPQLLNYFISCSDITQYILNLWYILNDHSKGIRWHRWGMGLEKLYYHLWNKWWPVACAGTLKSKSSIKAPDNRSTAPRHQRLPVLLCKRKTNECQIK